MADVPLFGGGLGACVHMPVSRCGVFREGKYLGVREGVVLVEFVYTCMCVCLFVCVCVCVCLFVCV